MKNLYTSESISYGHSDKISDIIAETLVDEFLKQDKNSRCGIEVMIKDNILVLGGEVNSTAKVDYDTVVRGVFEWLHFPSNHHLSPSEIKVINLIGQQSEEIHQGVDKSEEEIGSGDQGICFGYADNSTLEYMPLANQFSRDLWKRIIKVEGLGPDVKTQVTVTENNEITQVNVSTMHTMELETVRYIVSDLIDKLIMDRYPSQKYHKIEKIINLNGEWHIGGSVSDCGVTGRKLVADFYGHACQIGGGNLSGKDLSKVDKSGALMARYIAKNIVAADLADSAKVSLGYIISKPTLVSISIELKNGKVDSDSLIRFFEENVDLSVKGMIEKFSNISFAECAKYGYFCNDSYPWEKIDLVDKLRITFIGK